MYTKLQQNCLRKMLSEKKKKKNTKQQKKKKRKEKKEKEKAKWEVSLINSYLAFCIFLSFLLAFFYHIVLEIR